MMYSKLSNPYQEQSPKGICMNLENTGSHDERIYQPGVKIIMDNSPQFSVYSAYEDLPDYYKDSGNFTEVLSGLQEQTKCDDTDWKLQFDLIDNLRILNKFYPKVLSSNVHQFSHFILRCMDSLRTNLSKNTLMLVKETYENFKHMTPNEDFINVVLPRVLEKGISDKSFIKFEARSALKALENGGCYDSVIRVLCEKSFDKNVNVSELSFQALVGIIREAKENLVTRLSQPVIQLLFQTLIGAINGKRAANRRLAEELCQQLRADLPANEDELEGYLKEKLDLKEQGAKLIIKAMQNKKEKPVKSDLSAFIREKKMEKGSFDKKNKALETNNHNIHEGDEI